MLLKVFSVYDVKVGAYLPPIFMRSKLEAIRSFTSAVTDEKHQFAKHAEDFTLFELGDWDDGDCKFKCHLTPIPVLKAIEAVAVVDNRSELQTIADLSRKVNNG